MPGHIINLVGKKFGKLTALEYVGKQHWKVQCDCGTTKIIYGPNLRKGLTKSCGCITRERMRNIHTIHGGSYTVLFKKWLQMRKRCNCKGVHGLHNYGGRGIKVCAEWDKSFEKFRDWALNNGYKDGLSIDRIDPNLNYCPENCRWATFEEQMNNRRNTVWAEIDGEKMSIGALSKLYNVPHWKLYNRIKNLGWSAKKAITIPCVLFLLSGCVSRGCAPIEYPSCPPMLREATYKAMQADERRDYRIAIEKCKIGENARPVN